MKKKISLMLALVLCALLAQAQEAPPNSDWASDPLDVLEPQKSEETAPPTSEFQEISPQEQSQGSAPSESSELPAVSLSSMPAGGNEPDRNQEEEFHRIYKSYNEQPTSVESWEKAVKGGSSETYQIQRGDTLSDISETLFGDPFFWPKVWSLNKDTILNPHEISPGMNVQFFPGSLNESPSLGVIGAAGAGSQESLVTGGAPVKEAEAAPVVGEIPPPKKKNPVLKKLPSSLPQHQFALNARSSDVKMELARVKFPAPSEYLSFYIADAPVSGVGKIVATEGDMKTAGEFQYVFVQIEGGGKEFTVQKNVDGVKDPQNKLRQGHMVEIQGEVEVMEQVNDRTNTYRALVKKSLSPVEVGSLLVPGRIPMIDASSGAPQSGVGARIMGGAFDRKRNLFGTNGYVFLDSGANQGLQEGQSLSVFADEKSRIQKIQADMNNRVVGTVKIVRVAQNFATGYVTNATDDIRLGDMVGTPAYRASTTGSDLGSGGDDFEKEFESAPDSSSGELTPDSGGSDSELDF